jgi:hypothetical protein
MGIAEQLRRKCIFHNELCEYGIRVVLDNNRGCSTKTAVNLPSDIWDDLPALVLFKLELDGNE